MEIGHRRISVSRVLAAFALTCLIFISGILIGTNISQNKIEDINTIKQELELELTQLDLESLLIETVCIDPLPLVDRINDLETRLNYLETQYEKNDPRIIELKKPYALLEIRHYIRMKKMNEFCNQTYSLILFFYSNANELRAESEKQGFVLNYIRSKYDNIKVYSFDSDLDMMIIKDLKTIYNVTAIPTIVVDGKTYSGFLDKPEVESLIGINNTE